MSNCEPDAVVEKRQQLMERYEKMMQTLGQTAVPDRLVLAKEFAETLRKRLEYELETNEALWNEKNILQTMNKHMNKTIADNQELIDELNKIAKEENDNDDAADD